MSGDFIIYGASGYTGRLLAAQAVQRGLTPLLAGRNLAKVEEVARPLGLEARGVDLADAPALRALIRGHRAVLHAAGPFFETSAPMVEACLQEGASYLDITGELGVFGAVFARDAAARAAKVALIPGVGFDVVPTDCLAQYVAQKVPGATSLEIALVMGDAPSAGTVKSLLRVAIEGGFVRRHGDLVHQSFGRGVHRVRFSRGEHWAIPAPTGDLETAFRSTRIPNITTSIAVSKAVARALQVGWPAMALGLPVVGRALEVPTVHTAVSGFIERRVRGPDAKTRAAGRTAVWARALGGGKSAEAWLDTAEGYDFTSHAAILAVERVLADRPVGALTPSLAFGADFTLQVPGTTRTDVPA